MTINWNTVRSSQISAIAYENDLLYVKFASGQVYRYLNVSPETFSAVLTAESVGKTFNLLIKAKPHEHPFTQLLNDPGDVRLAPGLHENNPAMG